MVCPLQHVYRCHLLSRLHSDFEILLPTAWFYHKDISGGHRVKISRPVANLVECPPPRVVVLVCAVRQQGPEEGMVSLAGSTFGQHYLLHGPLWICSLSFLITDACTSALTTVACGYDTGRASWVWLQTPAWGWSRTRTQSHPNLPGCGTRAWEGGRRVRRGREMNVAKMVSEDTE